MHVHILQIDICIGEACESVSGEKRAWHMYIVFTGMESPSGVKQQFTKEVDGSGLQ